MSTQVIDHRAEAERQLERDDHYANTDHFTGDRAAFCAAYRQRALVHAVLFVGEIVATLVDDLRAREPVRRS